MSTATHIDADDKSSAGPYPQLTLREVAWSDDVDVEFNEVGYSEGAADYVALARQFPLPGKRSSFLAERLPTLSFVPDPTHHHTALVMQTALNIVEPDTLQRRVIVTKNNGWTLPLQSWRAPDWDLEPQRLHPLPVADQLPIGDLLTDQVIQRFLADRDWLATDQFGESLRDLDSNARRALLTWTLCGVLGCLEDRVTTQLVINAEPDVVALLLYGVARLLPMQLLQDVGFTTLATTVNLRDRHRHFVQIMGTHSPMASIKDLSGKTAIKCYVVNFYHRPQESGFLYCGKPHASADERWIKSIISAVGRDGNQFQKIRQLFKSCEDVASLRQVVQQKREKSHSRENASDEPSTLSSPDAMADPADSPKATRQAVSQSRETRRLTLPDMLRQREFDDWDKCWNVFLERLDRARTDKELSPVCGDCLILLRLASDDNNETPFRIRDTMFRTLDRREEKLSHCSEYCDPIGDILKRTDEFLALTSSQDIHEIGEAGYNGAEVGLFLARSTLRLQERQTDEDRIAEFAEAVVETLLSAPVSQMETDDLVRSFSEHVKTADSPTIKATLSLLVRASGDRCLQLLLTLLNDGVVESEDFDFGLVRNLIDDRQCYDGVNDPDWLAAKGEYAFSCDGIAHLFNFMESRKHEDLLWLALCRGLDKRLLLKDKSQLRRFDVLNGECRMKLNWYVAPRAIYELDQWDTLLRQCQPVAMSVLKSVRLRQLLSAIGLCLVILGYGMHWLLFPWPREVTWMPFELDWRTITVVLVLLPVAVLTVLYVLEYPPFAEPDQPSKSKKSKGKKGKKTSPYRQSWERFKR